MTEEQIKSKQHDLLEKMKTAITVIDLHDGRNPRLTNDANANLKLIHGFLSQLLMGDFDDASPEEFEAEAAV